MSYPGYDYPSDKALKKISTWEWKDNMSLPAWFLFIKNHWWMPDWGWTEKGRTLWISTGGWSGNESIISAMEKNFMWSLSWQSSRRGGHFKFHIPRFKKAPRK